MKFAAQRPLFSDDELRASYRREQQFREDARKFIEQRIAPQVGYIHAAAEVARIKLRTAVASLTHSNADPRQEVTVEIAGKEFERLIELCAKGEGNESQQRLVVTAREHPERILSMLQASFDAPSVNRFWRHHGKTHETAELGAAGQGLLSKLVREHYENIPGVEDLRGRGR